MGWQKSYGPIVVHWDEPNPPHGTLPCFAPITQAELDALPEELRWWLFDPCTMAHHTSVHGEIRDAKSRAARWREIKDRRAYKAEERQARQARV